jgi:hypothetical protein
MTPAEFCQQVMQEYERQWAAAAGHQERHPLRAKMRELEALMSEAGDAEQFGRLLEDGLVSAAPFRQLLCNELAPRWERQRSSGSPGRGR